MGIKRSILLLLFLVLFLPITACDKVNTTTNDNLDWPDDLLEKFPAWPELDGKITNINNRSVGTELYEINYYITAKINGDYQLVLDYILRVQNNGYSETYQQHEWNSAYEDIQTTLEIECSVYDGWSCNGPWFSIDIGTGTSALYIYIIYAWGDASLSN